MRTNLVLNEDLLEEASKYSHARSKRALVEEALIEFIRAKSVERKTQTYRERVRALEGKLAGLRLRESPLKVLRGARERS